MGQPGRMHHRTPLPATLGDRFTVREAAAAGVLRGRAAARDLARPFHGVRARTRPETPLQKVLCVVPRLRADQLVAGRTALRVWGYPCPGAWALEDDVVVAVPTDAVRPRTHGIRGVRLAPGRARRWLVGGIPVVDPLAALFMDAVSMTQMQIVVLLDAMLTVSPHYPGLPDNRPAHTRDEIAARLAQWGRFPGCRRVHEALSSARERVESPKETETRLLIVGAGLPEPEVQYEVRDGHQLVARTDLAYPRRKIAIEYEGDGHRTSREQWRRDIQRQRDLEDRGWIVIRVTELDLRAGGEAFLRRLRRALADR